MSVYEYNTDAKFPPGYVGCYVDKTGDRVLTGDVFSAYPGMTAEVRRRAAHYRTQWLRGTLPSHRPEIKRASMTFALYCGSRDRRTTSVTHVHFATI